MKILTKAILALAFIGNAAGAQTTTVYVVRHAEKEAEPAADPALTASGQARASLLSDMLKDAGISAIITTEFKRTRLTGADLQQKLAINPEIVGARAAGHAKLVADTVLMKHRGQSVLVVGHSNTVPDIVAALGAPKPEPICDAGYDNMYIVTVPASGAATVARLHYGTKTSCP